MNALNRRLIKVERAIPADCEKCRHRRFENLTDEELDRQIKDLRRREYSILPIEKLKEKIREIEDAIEKRKGLYDRGSKKMLELLADEEPDCSNPKKE